MAETASLKVDPSSAKPIGEVFGGLAAVLVALPSAIAYGLVIYGPLGPEFSGTAIIAGITGTIFIGLLAAIFGGTPALISAPCAPAAAVLSVFALELSQGGKVDPLLIPQVLAVAAFGAGLLQLALGALGGGKLIKFIPYPVVAGYLSGVGLTIIIGQVPKFFGYDKHLDLWTGLSNPAGWKPTGLAVGIITVLTMILAPKVTKKVPAAILSLVAGLASYFALSAFFPELRVLEHNKQVIGMIQATLPDLAANLGKHWGGLLSLGPTALATVFVPAATLAVLLSIDTLKTCVVLGVMTGQRNDSNRELVAQGIGNGVSALFGGMPGAGTMGATLVNLSSGGRTRLSGILEGAFGVAILLLLAQFIAWIPISALAGILLVVGFRMIDLKSLDLVKHKSTRLDFAVIVAVVVAALSYSLLVASGVGIAMAIILFLREQVGFPVIRHKRDGSKVFSKKRRTEEERAVLEAHGGSTTVCELQGQLFFGTADQLYTQLEGSFATSRRLIIDLKRVRSIDFTAVNMLKQIHRKVHEHDGILCLSSIKAGLAGGITMLEYMNELGFAQENESLKITASLEEAIQWSEDSLLAEHQVVRDPRPFEIEQFSLFRGIPEEVMAIIAGSIELRQLPAGQKVFSQGEMSDEIFFIRSGAVKISLALQGGGSHELATFQKGDFFGEMAFLDKDRRSADAIADGDASIYAFSHARFREIARGHPDAGTIVFSRLAKEISHRLRLNNIELKGLEES